MSQRGTAATRRGVHSSNTSPSKPGLDSELEDFLQASKSITDNVRQGLELLSTEEDQLLKLRQQLGKIKRLREEQQQKDQVIQQLQERVAVLQHEKTTTGQQNSDLYVIMTERIHTLERHLQERDHVERRLEDQIASLECDLTRLPQVEQDLADSKSQCQQLTVQLHNAHEETNSLKLQLQQEKHLQDHFHATIESLTKDRLQHEEAVDHLKSEKQQEMTYLREEIMSLKQINEELRSKWRQSEQSKQQQDLEMFKTKHALEVLQQDHQAIQREYERYQQSNSQDTLQVVELKTTLTTLEFQHEQLQSEANADKAKYKTEINTLKTELRAIRSSVSEELSIFCHAMEDILQKDESDRSNAGLAAWQCRLLSSMRVAMSSCEGQDLHVVVHQLCVLLQHVLSLQLHASSEQRPFSWKKKPRSSPAKDGNETTAGQLRVTQAFDLVQTLLSQRMTGYHRCDTALDVLIQLIQQHYQMLPLQLSAVDMEMLTAPRGNSVHQNVNLDAELYHQRREKQLEVLLTAMQQIFQKLRESHQEKDLRHYLQDCQHELSHLHQKYAADVQSLQRSSDEAYLAVQVHSLEHEKTIDQLKVDNQRNLAIQREHYESQLANSNDSLHEVCQAFDYVTVLMLYALTSNPALGNVSSPSLNDTNASTSPVIKATDYPLHFAYQISSKFAHGYAILLHDVKTLCELSAMPTDEVIQQHCDSLAASPTNAIPAVMSLMNYMDNGITGSASLETYQSNTVNKRPSLRSVALMILAANRWIRLSHKSQRSQAGVPSSLLSMEVSSKQQIAVDDIVASYLRSRSLGVDGTSALDRLHCFFPSSQLRNWKADELALQLASIHNINEVKQEVQKRVQDFVQHLSSRIEAVDKDQQKMKKKSTRPTDNDHKYVLSEHMRKRLHNRTLFEVLTQSNEDGFVNMHFHHHPKTLAQVHARPTEQEQLRKKKELFAQYELNHLHQYIVSKALEQQENSLKMNSLHVLMSRMQEDMQMCKHSLEESMREKEKLREQVVQLTRQQSQHANNSTPERSFASKAGSLPTRGHSITPERRPVKEFPADMSLQDSFTSSVADGGLDWTRWSRNTSIYDQWSRASHDQPSTTASAAFPPRANTNASSVASVAPSAKHQQILTSKDFRESLNSIYSATSSTKPISKSLDQIVFEGKKEPTSATKKDQQELMEIYQDIGRLTRKLEDRLSESDHQQYMKHPGKGSPSTSSPPQLSSATTMMMSSRRSSSSANNNTSRGQPLPSQPTTSAFASRNNRSTNSSFSSYQKNM